jgi:hypothetical protein
MTHAMRVRLTQSMCELEREIVADYAAVGRCRRPLAQSMFDVQSVLDYLCADFDGPAGVVREDARFLFERNTFFDAGPPAAAATVFGRRQLTRPPPSHLLLPRARSRSPPRVPTVDPALLHSTANVAPSLPLQAPIEHVSTTTVLDTSFAPVDVAVPAARGNGQASVRLNTPMMKLAEIDISCKACKTLLRASSLRCHWYSSKHIAMMRNYAAEQRFCSLDCERRRVHERVWVTRSEHMERQSTLTDRALIGNPENLLCSQCGGVCLRRYSPPVAEINLNVQ